MPKARTLLISYVRLCNGNRPTGPDLLGDEKVSAPRAAFRRPNTGEHHDPALSEACTLHSLDRDACTAACVRWRDEHRQRWPARWTSRLGDSFDGRCPRDGWCARNRQRTCIGWETWFGRLVSYRRSRNRWRALFWWLARHGRLADGWIGWSLQLDDVRYVPGVQLLRRFVRELRK